MKPLDIKQYEPAKAQPRNEVEKIFFVSNNQAHFGGQYYD